MAAEKSDLKVVLLLNLRKRMNTHYWSTVNVDTCPRTNATVNNLNVQLLPLGPL